jgi:pSer/pThr/pTyr-binding forkhead associated (FHA) protein/ferredoxin
VNDRALMLVNQDGEVSLPGVFLVGDARGPRYLRCTDFDDSNTYEQVVQKRNIKAAMVEAVDAVERIAVRAGKDAVKVVQQVASAPPVVPPTPSDPADAQPHNVTVQLVALLADGTPEEEFAISQDVTIIGRTAADITADDVYMADHHATLTKRGDDYVIEDTGSGSGVWIRAHGVNGRPVGEGDVAWVGAQILMVTMDNERWALAHYNGDGVYQATYPLGERGLFVGRGSEVPLDANDLTLSRRHAQFRVEGGTLKVFDLGSRNGTYAKVAKSIKLASGDEFRVASKRFRFERFSPVAKLAATDVVGEAPPLEAAPPAAAAAAEVAEGLFPVTIEHAEFPVSFGVPPGKDVLHAYFESIKTRFSGCKLSRTGEPAEHMDEPLGWECKVGLCGLCAVQVLEGAANLAPVDPGSPEMNTIANKAFLEADPKKYRLACLVKVKGAVKLAIPG